MPGLVSIDDTLLGQGLFLRGALRVNPIRGGHAELSRFKFGDCDWHDYPQEIEKF